MPTSGSSETLRFGEFELDLGAYQLRRNGHPIKLERRPMDLLILLIEKRGRLVSRSDIAERLWEKDVFVDVETGVNIAISKVRQALRDSPEAPALVETIVGKGYRFIGAVDGPPAFSTASAAPEAPVTRPHPPAPVHGLRRFGRARVTAGVWVVAVVAGFATWAWLAARKPVRVAVLAFENLTGDSDREYLADGLTEEAIVALGQIDPDHISVIGRRSTMAYKRSAKSLGEIARELDAHYVVESSIRAENDRLRVTSKLIRARDQVQVWSDSYDREPGSLLELQRELSTAIAEQIRDRLSPERVAALARRHTRKPDAYDLYLRGRYYANQRTPAMVARALEHYRQATVLDPTYALAWSGIADAYTSRPINSDFQPLDVRETARAAAERAVRAEPRLAEAQTALGRVSFWLDWDWPAAERAFRQAIVLDPAYASAHLMLGHVLSQSGRHSEAADALRRARALDPLHAMNHAISAQVAFQARDYSAALEHARQAVVVDPDFWIGHAQQGQAYEQLGKPDLALEALAKAARFSGGKSMTLALRGYLLARLGRTGEAREVLKTLEAVSRDRYLPPTGMALVHAGLGEREAVHEWLERAYAARDVHLVFLPVDPKWDPYRADPHFKALMVRCGFGLPRDGASSVVSDSELSARRRE
jgi:TolB-like protein/DNA-binding winged helix-turn-helix (wHTH) protein/Tfp pilus assembly protein PilF